MIADKVKLLKVVELLSLVKLTYEAFVSKLTLRPSPVEGFVMMCMAFVVGMVKV